MKTGLLNSLARVRLEPGAAPDRDFVLLISGLAGQSRALAGPDKKKWMVCASFLARMEDIRPSPLALKILVDCSGSMS
ncbi:MAG: hypothetical protein K2H64_02265 [Desulfovibrio sp.]|nr:hypothetical protein [Desulfovibrio sp.]